MITLLPKPLYYINLYKKKKTKQRRMTMLQLTLYIVIMLGCYIIIVEKVVKTVFRKRFILFVFEVFYRIGSYVYGLIYI